MSGPTPSKMEAQYNRGQQSDQDKGIIIGFKEGYGKGQLAGREEGYGRGYRDGANEQQARTDRNIKALEQIAMAMKEQGPLLQQKQTRKSKKKSPLDSGTDNEN